MLFDKETRRKMESDDNRDGEHRTGKGYDDNDGSGREDDTASPGINSGPPGDNSLFGIIVIAIFALGIIGGIIYAIY